MLSSKSLLLALTVAHALASAVATRTYTPHAIRTPEQQAASFYKAASVHASNSKPNNRPLIGILTQAGLEDDTFVPKDGSYIAASYVKFVESAGARVVPILHDSPKEVVSNKPPIAADWKFIHTRLKEARQKRVGAVPTAELSGDA